MSKPAALKVAVSHGRCFAIFCLMAVSANGDSPKTTKDPPPQNQALRDELIAMGREDQAVRIDGLQAMKKLGISFGDASQLKDPKVREFLEQQAEKSKQVDEKHRRRLEQIIAEHGWPGKSLVGRDGANSAWLIVQHADADVKFQRQCLELLEAAPEGEVELQHVAYLTDRVLVNEGKPQRYGTQMGENFQPRPLEDSENVDKRRSEVGLPPLAEYVKTAKEAYEQMASGEINSDQSER